MALEVKLNYTSVVNFAMQQNHAPVIQELRLLNNTESPIEDIDVVITFDHVAKGLKAKNRYGYLCGFSIAGDDGKYHWVKGRVEGRNTVRLDVRGISHPRAVRYAWADNPDDANLYNSEDLPSTPFEIDIKP